MPRKSMAEKEKKGGEGGEEDSTSEKPGLVLLMSSDFVHTVLGLELKLSGSLSPYFLHKRHNDDPKLRRLLEQTT